MSRAMVGGHARKNWGLSLIKIQCVTSSSRESMIPLVRPDEGAPLVRPRAGGSRRGRAALVSALVSVAACAFVATAWSRPQPRAALASSKPLVTDDRYDATEEKTWIGKAGERDDDITERCRVLSRARLDASRTAAT